MSAFLPLGRCGWYLSIFCEYTKADVLGCRLCSFLALAAGLCALLPAASDGCVPHGGVGPPRPKAMLPRCPRINLPRTRMVLNHRIYYQLLKHDLLISFDKSNHASEDTPPAPSRLPAHAFWPFSLCGLESRAAQRILSFVCCSGALQMRSRTSSSTSGWCAARAGCC